MSEKIGYTLQAFYTALDKASAGVPPEKIAVEIDTMDEVRQDNSRLPTFKFNYVIGPGNYEKATLTIMPQGADVMAFPARTASRRVSQY